jgi:hypothetical protein
VKESGTAARDIGCRNLEAEIIWRETKIEPRKRYPATDSITITTGKIWLRKHGFFFMNRT